jgi:hypothetical protein
VGERSEQEAPDYGVAIFKALGLFVTTAVRSFLAAGRNFE